MTPFDLPSWLGFLDVHTLFAWFPGSAFLAVACPLVVIETGLLFPFLPGDSLLFVTGLLIAEGSLGVPLWLAALALAASAFIGDQIAYLIGNRLGRRIVDRPTTRLVKPEYIAKTSHYFSRYGGRTIVIARFVPVVRTFAAVLAGASRMRYRKFLAFNAMGAILWGVGLTVAGYYLGQVAFVRDHIELILVLIVVASMVPILVESGRSWRLRRAARSAR